MPLVGVPGLRLDVECAQHAHAAHAQHPLLTQSQRGAAGVELGEERAVIRMVLLELGIEEVDRHPTDVEAPGADVHVAPEGRHGGEIRHASGPRDRRDGREREVEAFVGILLAPLEVDGLVEVPVAIEDADANQGHAQVRSRLAVVARQHPQAARVDRYGVVHAELGAEVRDRLRAMLGPGGREPGAGTGLLVPEPAHHPVIQRRDVRVEGGGLKPLRGHLVEELQRIVSDGMPETFVDGAKDDARFAVPAPRKIAGDAGEPGKPVGNRDGQTGCRESGRPRLIGTGEVGASYAGEPA